MAPYYRSKAFPRYQSDTAIVPNNSWTTSGLTYDVLQRGGLTYNQMDQAGGRPELAPYPDWQAQYSIHKGSSQRTATLLNGDYAGSQSLMHVRENDQSLPSIDARPNWYLSFSGEAGTDPLLCNLSTGSSCNLDRNPLYPNYYHAPSLCLFPYLLTGDRYYHDEVVFWANWCLGVQAPGRHGSQGIVCNDGNVRGIGWMLRLITEAAAFAADADPMRAIFRDKLANNLTWCDDFAAGTQAWEFNNSHVHNTTEINSSFIYPNQTYTPDGGSHYACYMALWQQNVVVYAITRANDLGFTGGTDLRDRLALHQVGALTHDPDWPRATYGTGYYPGWGTFPAGSPAEANWTMKTTWADAYQLNVDDGQVAEFGSTGFAFYGQDARHSALVAQEAGLTGGSSAYSYIDGVMAATPTLYYNRGGWAFSSTRYA
jgi:hypothetical protein